MQFFHADSASIISAPYYSAAGGSAIYRHLCPETDTLATALQTYFAQVYMINRENYTIAILNANHYITEGDLSNLLLQSDVKVPNGLSSTQKIKYDSSLLHNINHLFKIAFTDYIRSTITSRDFSVPNIKTEDITTQLPDSLSRLLLQQDIASYIHDVWAKDIAHKRIIIFIGIISSYSLLNDLDLSPDDIEKLYIQLTHTVNDEDDFEIFVYKTFHLPFHQQTEDSTKYSAKILHAIHYIEANHRRDISLEETAEEIHLNPSYLSHSFKKETGVTFLQYLNNLRIEKACELLSESDMTVEDIAFKVGYNSSS